MVAAEIELKELGWVPLRTSNAEHSGGLLAWSKVVA